MDLQIRWGSWLSAALLLCVPLASAATAGEELTHLVVLHTNDIHGQVLPRPAIWLKDVNPLPDSGGLPRLAAKLNQLKAEAEAEGAGVVICDGGDWFQGTPEGQILSLIHI